MPVTRWVGTGTDHEFFEEVNYFKYTLALNAIIISNFQQTNFSKISKFPDLIKLWYIYDEKGLNSNYQQRFRFGVLHRDNL